MEYYKAKKIDRFEEYDATTVYTEIAINPFKVVYVEDIEGECVVHLDNGESIMVEGNLRDVMFGIADADYVSRLDLAYTLLQGGKRR